MEVTEPVAQQVSSQGPDFIPILVGLIALVAFLLVLIGLSAYFKKFLVGWIRDRDREKRSLQFVLIQITVPKDNEIKIDAIEQLFATFASLHKPKGFLADFKPLTYISFEIVALHESIKFFVSCHKDQRD